MAFWKFRRRGARWQARLAATHCGLARSAHVIFLQLSSPRISTGCTFLDHDSLQLHFVLSRCSLTFCTPVWRTSQQWRYVAAIESADALRSPADAHQPIIVLVKRVYHPSTRSC
jgi:hypothetical protein